jgi:hypothetical protein
VFKQAAGRTAATFNPCRGAATRFAPLYSAELATLGQCVPTLYAGKAFEGAVFEAILRDLPPRPHRRRVFERDYQGAALAELTLRRPLILARLFKQELATLALTRRALIESHGIDAYKWTVTWAAAMHRDNPVVDGLTWHSRQQESEQVYMFFGGRADENDFDIGPLLPLDAGHGRLRLDAMVKTYRVTVVPLVP